LLCFRFLGHDSRPSSRSSRTGQSADTSFGQDILGGFNSLTFGGQTTSTSVEPSSDSSRKRGASSSPEQAVDYSKKSKRLESSTPVTGTDAPSTSSGFSSAMSNPLPTSYSGPDPTQVCFDVFYSNGFCFNVCLMFVCVVNVGFSFMCVCV
jgi:hypothetical protein